MFSQFEHIYDFAECVAQESSSQDGCSAVFYLSFHKPRSVCETQGTGTEEMDFVHSPQP